MEYTNVSFSILAEEVSECEKRARQGGVVGNGSRNVIDTHTERVDLGRSIEEVGDGGANVDVIDSNSSEEDEGVVGVVLPKKGRERPLGCWKSKIAAPKRDWKTSGS